MDARSLHNLLITLHAASGVVGFLAGGWLVFSPRQASNRLLFDLYAGALVSMVLFLAGAMLVYWNQYSATERILFSGLLVLGLYMLYRARGAHRVLATQPGNWRYAYLEHIGFTLISLLEGFIFITAINAGSPWWLVALLALLGFFLGRWALGLAQRRSETYPSLAAKP